MKLTKNYIATLLGLTIAGSSYAQDLIQQVPEHASFVIVINNEAIVKHSSFEKINEVLDKLGAFDDFGKQEVQIQSITDLDLSYDRSAYIYKTDTDSAYYTGILLPLRAGHQIGTSLFSKLSPLPSSQGYERRVSTDGKTQVAWNEHSLFVLTGDARSYYFDSDSVAQRYGIEQPDYGYGGAETSDYWSITPDTAYVDDVVEMADAADASAIVDSVDTAWYAYDFDVDAVDSVLSNIPPPAIPETEQTDYSDYDSYTDSTYLKEIARNAKNDSLRNAAFASWLAQDFDGYLHPDRSATSYKRLHKFDKKNTLVHFWAKDLIGLYKETLPYSMMSLMSGYYGYGNGMENILYAYQDIVLDLVQDKHTLKLQGSVDLNEEMDRIIRPIYKNKMNRKFAKYIPENHIGYLSMNINAQSYLKALPTMMEYIYGSFHYSIGEMSGIIATALDIALDEKAIANVMGGDHVLFITEMKKVQKEYIDYEYNEENYDYKEIKKTKDDYIPTFLWMFTSKDQRIYHRILELGQSKEKVIQTDGIYKIIDNPSDELMYILFKDDIVFVSNDEDQLSAIRTNQFRASRDKHIKKQIYSNNMTAVTHLAEIPETINRLGIPVITRWDHMMNNLSQYGDITITAQGTKKGRITGEMAVDFPKQEANALQYLLQEVLNTIE